MAENTKKEPDIWVADFETKVLSKKDLKKLGLKEQTETEIWSAAIMRSVGPDQIENEPVYVFNNVFEFMNFLEYNVPNNSIIYFHNLRFDANYLLSHLINVENWRPCVRLDEE